MVNANVCTTAFYVAQNLAKAMIEFHRASFGTEMNGKGMSHLVSGVRVQTINLGDWKTVKEVARVNAKQRRFFAAELGEVSVEEYSSENTTLFCSTPTYLSLTLVARKESRPGRKEKPDEESSAS